MLLFLQADDNAGEVDGRRAPINVTLFRNCTGYALVAVETQRLGLRSCVTASAIRNVPAATSAAKRSIWATCLAGKV